MSEPTSFAWSRRGHRLHDNAALAAACGADRAVPVYRVDPCGYGDRPFGDPGSFDFEKAGAHRACFRLESLVDLQTSLRDRGSDLIVREGYLESALPEVATVVDADFVTVHMRPIPEESHVESAVEARLRDDGVELRRFWGHTLTHLDGLPMALSDFPNTYMTSWKAVELAAEDARAGDAAADDEHASDDDPGGRDPLPGPTVLPLPDDAPDVGDLPAVSNLVRTAGANVDRASDDRGIFPFDSGEAAALDRVGSYIWADDHLHEYKEARNGLLGVDYFLRFSLWLNEGCPSSRYVKAEVDCHEDRRVENDLTYWFVLELRWRDFFQSQFVKHGSDYFHREGIRGRAGIDWWRDNA